MEVTRENFNAVLTKLPGEIENARFITIDTEFTGLRLRGLCSTNELDTPETLYRKQKNMIESFMVIQYGIVIYHFDEICDRLTYEAYNFYVYPSSLCSEVSFTCQASSLRFLAESGFDFNKLLREGIPFLREKELNKLLTSVDEKYHRDLNVDNQNIVIDNHGKQELLKPEIQTIMIQIAAAIRARRKEKIHIPRFNSFLRRLIYKSLHQKFRSKVFVMTNEDETMTAHVGLTLEEYQKEVKQKFSNKKDNIEDNIGFSHVIDLIIQSVSITIHLVLTVLLSFTPHSIWNNVQNCVNLGRTKKIIVGHNMFLDLMFTINQFIRPLPPTLREFMDVVQMLFPHVIDTKYIASTSELKNLTDTNLYSLHAYVKKVNAIPKLWPTDLSVGFGVDDSVTHKASFDAYLTGECFLGLCTIAGKDYRLVFKTVPEVCPIAFAVNKVSIRKLQDTPSFISLNGEIPNPDRSNVFHLKFPPDWKKDDIMKIFHSCGTIKVGWLSDTSAYLSFEPKYLQQVQTLVGVNPAYELTSFRDYFQL